MLTLTSAKGRLDRTGLHLEELRFVNADDMTGFEEPLQHLALQLRHSLDKLGLHRLWELGVHTGGDAPLPILLILVLERGQD